MTQEMTTASSGQWPPKTCEMPDLSGLKSKAVLTLILNRMFAGGGPKNSKSYALVMNFVRIVDKLITEYDETRASFTEFVNTPNNVILPLFVATGECESCITTIVRSINLVRRIRRDHTGPQIAQKIPALSDGVWSRLNGMRNAIEHIDTQIANNTRVPGEPVCLLLKNDRLELIGEVIEYKDLADWIRQLQQLSEQLAQYKEP